VEVILCLALLLQLAVVAVEINRAQVLPHLVVLVVERLEITTHKLLVLLVRGTPVTLTTLTT
jgi:hypothetical protein